jgi:hypothetical protein
MFGPVKDCDQQMSGPACFTTAEGTMSNLFVELRGKVVLRPRIRVSKSVEVLLTMEAQKADREIGYVVSKLLEEYYGGKKSNQ